MNAWAAPAPYAPTYELWLLPIRISPAWWRRKLSALISIIG